MHSNKVSIRIQNFRNIQDFTFELKPYSFLFGSNGSGKTSFIKALLFLRSNIFPLRLNETVYQISDSISLGNFKDIVHQNDLKKKIRFEIKIIQNDLESEPIDYLEGLWPEDDFDYLISHRDFAVKKVKKYKSRIKKNIISDFNETPNLNCSINVEFGNDIQGNNLHLFELADNTSKAKFYLKRKKHPLNTSDPTLQLEKNYNLGIKLDIDEDILALFKDFIINPFNLSFVNESSDRSKYIMDFWENISISTNEDRNNLNDFDLAMKESIKNFQNALIKKLYEIQKKHTWKKISVAEKKVVINKIIDSTDLFKRRIPIALRKYLQIIHVPTIRQIPQHNYLLNKKNFKKEDYYSILACIDSEMNGIEESILGNKKPIYIKSILKHVDNEIKQKTKKANVSSDLFTERTENVLTLITEKLRHLNLANYIFVEKNFNTGQLKLISSEGVIFNIAEGSSGLQQILPILFFCSKWYLNLFHNVEFNLPPLIFIEQPELHLHPKLQVKLLEGLIEEKGINLCFETHSEHIIRKIQLLLAQGKLLKDDVVVYYFMKKNGSTNVKEMDLKEDGFFVEPWPDGFFDDASNLSFELLEAQINRNN